MKPENETKITMRENKNKSKVQEELFKVGQYIPKFNDILRINLPINDIMQSSGLKIHIQKRHLDCVKYMSKIEEIIKKIT